MDWKLVPTPGCKTTPTGGGTLFFRCLQWVRMSKEKPDCQGISSSLPRWLQSQTLRREEGHCQRHFSSSCITLVIGVHLPYVLRKPPLSLQTAQGRKQAARLCSFITHGPLGRADVCGLIMQSTWDTHERGSDYYQMGRGLSRPGKRGVSGPGWLHWNAETDAAQSSLEG